MNKYHNKYRIESTRLQNWDYGWNAAYFITICAQKREPYFGEIIDDKMHLSSIGIIANVLWYEIKNHAENVELDAFVVMPNHIHGIVILKGENKKEEGEQPDKSHSNNRQFLSGSIGQSRFQHIGHNSISSIIGSYKSAVTKHSNRLGFDFGWQPRFYDHIIRSESSYEKIQSYIVSNPSKWNEDTFHDK